MNVESSTIDATIRREFNLKEDKYSLIDTSNDTIVDFPCQTIRSVYDAVLLCQIFLANTDRFLNSTVHVHKR